MFYFSSRHIGVTSYMQHWIRNYWDWQDKIESEQEIT